MSYVSVHVVTEKDVERSSTLEITDIGRPAVMIHGAWNLFDSEQRARDVANLINQDIREEELAEIEEPRPAYKWDDEVGASFPHWD